MDRADEGPPAKALRLSDPEAAPGDPQAPPPPPLLRLPLPPPQQRPRPREETEAAQVLAGMRGVGLGLGPALPPPPSYVILEEGGIRAYFTLGAEGSDWEPGFESGFGDPAPPPGNLDALTAEDAAAGSVEIDFQVVAPSSSAGEKARGTCSAGGWGPPLAAPAQGRGEAVILVDDEEGDGKESVKKKRRRRRRRQRKVKKGLKEVDAEKIECVLKALENVQLDLEAVNIKAGKAFLRLKRKFIQLQRPYLEQRDLIIQDIPGFWIKAFLNHPRISMLINQRDKDIFHYLTNLQVQDLRHISMGYKMKLYFQTNPYFTNTVIVKEFQRSSSGRLVSHSTPIRWHRGQEPQEQEPQGRKMKNQQVKRSFFTWFSNHNLPETDIIADIIKNDLWVNPLRYYMMGEGGYRANKKKQEKRKRKNRNGYKVVILEDYDDYHIMKDIIDDTSDSDFSDFESVRGIRISDFMETTDCFDTTDSEITKEKLSDHNKNHNIETTDDDDNPKDNEIIDNDSFDDETTDDEGPGNNSENSDNNEENPDNSGSSDDDSHPVGYKKLKGGNLSSSGSNQDSSESDIEFSDNDSSESSDDDDDDDDGNEGDDESSGDDDDDKDIEDSENDSEYFAKSQANRNNQNDDEYKVENFLESSVEEEEPDTEEGSKQENEENSEDERSCEEDVFKEIEQEDDTEESDMQEELLAPNTWVGPGKNSGRTG